MYNLWHKKQIGEIDHKYSKGVTILHLVKSALLSIPILLPPLSTQLAIVSELDKINELIRLKKEQLKDFDNLAQSLFYEMFGDPVENEKGWEVKKLGEIGKIVTGSTPSTKDESNYSPREYCFVKPSDLPFQGIVDIEETEYYVSKVGLSKSRVLPSGSVLVSCIGSIGKIGILTKEACSNQQINAIIPQEGIVSRFIAYSLYAQRFVLESIANAPVVPIINKTVFSKIRIPLPPLSLQRLFAQRIEQIDREKSEVQKSIQDLETLLASRMQYWFE